MANFIGWSLPGIFYLFPNDRTPFWKFSSRLSWFKTWFGERISDIYDTADFRHDISSQLPFRTLLHVSKLAARNVTGATHFGSLIGDSTPSESRDNDQPPIGPLQGCVPLWRVMIGCVCLCGGFFIVIKCDRRWSLAWGIGFVFSGSFLSLDTPIATTQSNKTDNGHFITAKV